MGVGADGDQGCQLSLDGLVEIVQQECLYLLDGYGLPGPLPDEHLRSGSLGDLSADDEVLVVDDEAVDILLYFLADELLEVLRPSDAVHVVDIPQIIPVHVHERGTQPRLHFFIYVF